MAENGVRKDKPLGSCHPQDIQTDGIKYCFYKVPDRGNEIAVHACKCTILLSALIQ